MSVRSSLGLFGSLAIFFVGLLAISLQAENVRQPAMNSTANGSSAAYNASRGVFEGVGSVGGQAVAIAGGAVFLLLCVGVWLTIRGGR